MQGGTFYNKAVLRAFEQISGTEAICPDIAGIMGAFGAALLAKSRYHGQPTTMLTAGEILKLTNQASTAHCGRCSNRCMLTVNTFPGGRKYITGNRCEKGSETPAPEISAQIWSNTNAAVFLITSLCRKQMPHAEYWESRVF